MDLIKANTIIHKLGLIPKGFFNPLDDKRYQEAGMHILTSTRSVGKTTNFLIIGLVLYWYQQIQTIYVRQSYDMIKPKNTQQLFDVILKCGYIELITKGAYNGVKQFSRYWYLASYDDDGNLISKSDKPFMVCVAVNENDDLKSSFSAPMGDWIIFDEFISSQNRYYPDEFFTFMDLIKTIIRDRSTPMINLLSNTIDKESRYFYEMEIRELVEFVEPDKTEILHTSKGTPIYFRLVTASQEQRETKLESFKRFFGFNHPKMVAITGVGGYFAFSEYPHLASKERIEYVARNIYLDYMHSKYLACDILYNADRGRLMAHIHKANTPDRDDAIILVTDTPTSPNQVTWHSPIGSKLINLINTNLVTFGTNSDGALLDKILDD